MHVSKVPETLVTLIPLAINALAGAENHDVGLRQNTHEAIETDFFDLVGNPENPLVPGKQVIFNHCKQALINARAEARAAIARGREYCRLGVALLKPMLGMNHNGNWEAAGFQTRSLAMPENPVVMLIEFRHYFEANPAQENALCGVTAADANALMSAIQSAQLAVAAAETAQLNARKARDLAQRALKKRISGLRAELAQLLSPADGAWQEFGFRRPAGGRIPEAVENVEVVPAGPGSVIVRWDAAKRAVNYRVAYRRTGDAPEQAIEVGLFSDLQAIITGLPVAAQIIVSVTARNASGETKPAEGRFGF